MGEAEKIMKFNKTDLVNAATEKSGFRKTDCEKMVEAVLDSIKEALGEGHRVELRGFGVFKAKEVEARTARNPKTGESVEVPQHVKVSFKPSKDIIA